MYFGREALHASTIPVYTLPRLASFLQSNGPWSQLVTLKNISLKPLTPDHEVVLSKQISITAFLVPHRDEFSETAGFKIKTTNKNYLFIPDIDKWERWNRNIIDQVRAVDIAFLDATFFSSEELPNRDIKEIPHPLVLETLNLFKGTPELNKIVFIHLNHTNKLLWNNGELKSFFDSGLFRAVQGVQY
jgi:pyrroloquinoline quinone biosynthesis protein B